MSNHSDTLNHVVVSEVSRDGKTFIQFDFHGHLDYAEAVQAIARWKELMTGDGRKDLIYNCTDMTGFDSGARKIWQAQLTELKSRIGIIWMISTNRIILTAAKTMALLAGFPMKTARTLEEVRG